ncbi:helix-turn-helix domain-containing protein [Nocardiopsis sp. CNT-189]|uniref:helix-turn-helix domain-containing protein n=1 Tax=Nocardiopsis oceanisediminis TaxID=2816862 RepID=UPI003B2A49C5
MTRSPSSSAQRAREEVAARLRELRLDAGLSGRALSRRAGWHESKTSRIESGKQAAADADVTAWCRVCGAEGQAGDLIAASRAADSMYMEWRRLHRSGMRRAQTSRVPLYESTGLMRVYTCTVMPGLVQTPAYATALMGAITAFQKTPDDVAEAVAARMERNRVLHRGGHRFALVLEESVLHQRIGDAEAMAGQLGHLLSVMSLPSVSLGVIPHTARGRGVWPLETFTVFDSSRVHVELLSAQVTVTAPGEVGLYERAFAEQARAAVFGRAARRVIAAALDALE